MTQRMANCREQRGPGCGALTALMLPSIAGWLKTVA